MKRLSGLLSLIAVVAMLLFGAIPSLAQGEPLAASPAAESSDTSLYDAVLDDQREEIISETQGELSLYTINATIDPGAAIPTMDNASPVPVADAGAPAGPEGEPPSGEPLASASGSLELHFVNDTGSEITDLYLRLYPNDDRYGQGGIELENVTVDDQAVEPALSVSDTVAELPLAEPLGDGDTVAVSLDFTTTVVQGIDFYSTFLSAAPELGTVSFAHWYPIVAGYHAESGWVLDPVSMNGDLVYSSTALYDVTLTAPQDVSVVTTGSLVEESSAGDAVERTYVSGPAREFTVIVDDDFASMEQEVDGTTISVWYNPGREAGAEAILTYATQSLATFNELFGPYPFDSLDLVETQMLGPSGIEYSQLIGLDTTLFDPPGTLDQQGFPPGIVEYITAHEVAHQWWYGLVGSNNYAHAFLDEGLAEASTIMYFEHQYGEEMADLQTFLNHEVNYAYQIVLGGDHVINQPTDAFPDPNAYFILVYSKAALAFLDIREEIGADVFADALAAYADDLRFGVAEPEDLLSAFEEASGQNLEDLWNRWFETAGDRVVISVELDVDTSATPAP